MKRTKIFSAVLAGLFLLLSFAPAAGATTTNGSVFDYQKSVISQTNRLRGSANALALETELCTLALELAKLQDGYAGRDDYLPSGQAWTTLLRDNGYSYVEATYVLVATKSNLSSTQLVKEFKKSNEYALLYNRYTRAGVNWYYSEASQAYYYVMILTRPVTSLTEVPEGSKYAYRAVSTVGVNVRSGPGTDFDITGGLGKGQTVLVASVSGKWAKIFWDNSAYAYVHTSYIKKVADLGVAKASAKVNVREGAGTEFKILGQLKRGETVTIECYSGSWAQVQWRNGIGYVSLDYLK
ncbi:SH3 domain-containing protein [Eubacteriales bacterium OttesenSCG-928-K08]|nr:SH3 domain-containing protein [Eubacteriales bacterium OttesenSCG-928-K08]